MTALSQNVIPSSPDDWLHATRREINLTLETLIPTIETWPKALHHAQHHALMAPGKRFRPILCIAITDGLKAPRKAALRIGAVAEIVHTASLILDDLPCMDDADLRRGRETVHLAFSESTAVLAATNLLNRAFGIAARSQSLTAQQRIDIVDSLSRSVGSSGLIAGQIADLANADMSTATSKVERVNALKTGALFDFTIEAAAIIGDATEEQTKHLMAFSKQIGLAFQLLDDLKDEILSEAESQKSTKRDIGKATLVALEGQDGAMERLSNYMATARDSIKAAQLTTQSTLLHVIDTQFSLPS